MVKEFISLGVQSVSIFIAIKRILVKGCCRLTFCSMALSEDQIESSSALLSFLVYFMEKYLGL